MRQVLHHAFVSADGHRPTKTVAFLHGVLGCGRNWRPFARRLVAGRPKWRALLVDLRFHGGSRDVGDEETLDACGRDLARLEQALGLSLDAVAGHSFGGKVALAWLARAGRAAERRVWILDTAPGPGSIAGRGRIARVLASLDRIELAGATRSGVADALRGEGLPPDVAGWMTTNLEADGAGGLRWRFDLPRIRRLLDDYRRVDAWPVLESPPDATSFTFVRGGRSDVLDGADVRRLTRLSASGRLELHVLEDAGHWLHVDDRGGLLRLFSDAFAR